jgi:hypothetical protein
MGVGGDNAHGPAEQKFLLRFFQKALLPSLIQIKVPAFFVR